jgi:hypothetical protein
MKNLFTLLLCLPITLSAQNIPNAGFESWFIGQVVLEAEDWRSSNFYTFNQFGIYSVNPDMVNVAEGFTSARLSTSILDTLGAFTAYMVNGSPILNQVTGEVDIMSGGTPFPYRPSKMIGQYQFESNSPIEDFAQAHVILKKYNTATGERDTIGYGQNVLLNPSASFQTFEVPIQYLVPDVTPDSVIVILYSTYPDTPISGGELWVDDLSFEINTAISEIEEVVEVKIFPNPFMEIIKVEIITLKKGQIDLIDINGRKVVSKPLDEGDQTIEIETSVLPAGNYYINWRSENGESHLLEKLVKVD